MTQKAADDYDSIAQRLKEIEAEKLARVTAPDPVEEKPQPVESVYGYGGGIDYLAMKDALFTLEFNSPKQFAEKIKLACQAHPEWPYAGTGFEWRRFVRS